MLLFKTIFLFNFITLLPGFDFNKSFQFNFKNSSEVYVCMPCGHDCDKSIYKIPGKCPHCQMPLVKKSSVTFKSIQPSEICNYIHNHPDVILLDIRTKEEFEGKAIPDYGTLQNAINIPLQQIKNKLADMSSLKDKEIIVFCSHSHRSPQASYILSTNGFKKIINMDGGMSVMKDSACIK